MIDTTAIKENVDLRELAKLHTTLKPKGTPDKAKEWEGPCPKCRGTDRFYVRREWFACRGCHEKRGDAIEFIRWLDGLTFQEACERLGVSRDTSSAFGEKPTQRLPAPGVLAPPSETWQTTARSLVDRCQDALWSDVGAKALAWLRDVRGLSEGMIAAANLGYNDHDHRAEYQTWGLDPHPVRTGIWLPRGVTIPWEIGGELWRVNIRRPAGKPKYYAPPGCSNGLYCADLVKPGKPVVLVEGEMDALTIEQYAGDLVNGTATGSTGGARLVRWIGLLAITPLVLVAFDNEPDKGDKAAGYWLDALTNAKRWRPYWNDVNNMAQDGANVRSWVEAGLRQYHAP